MTELDQAILDALRVEADRAIPYCPYSNYPVQAAVCVREGIQTKFYHGANYEVISFNQTMHAEHSAITAALNARLSEEHRIIEAVYVQTPNGGPPCGHCRQIIAEYAVNPDIPIYVLGAGGDVHKYTLRELLPAAFTTIKDRYI